MNPVTDSLCADIHCHLLPGIDDGPGDWELTLAMARTAVSEGIDTIIATPHQLGRYESNTAACIRSLVAEAQCRLDLAKIPLRVLPGADVRIRHDLTELVNRGEVVTLGDRRAHLLVELPPELSIPLGTLQDRLRRRGITCILSHPERNHALADNAEFIQRWVQQGGLVQVTAGSITGFFGPEAQRATKRLLREGLVHLVATDAHDVTRRPPLLRAARTTVARWVGTELAQVLFVTNPRAVVAGTCIETSPALMRPGRSLAGWCKRAVASLYRQR
jgi:protein-tyrosine phosphatase